MPAQGKDVDSSYKTLCSRDGMMATQTGSFPKMVSLLLHSGWPSNLSYTKTAQVISLRNGGLLLINIKCLLSLQEKGKQTQPRMIQGGHHPSMPACLEGKARKGVLEKRRQVQCLERERRGSQGS